MRNREERGSEGGEGVKRDGKVCERWREDVYCVGSVIIGRGVICRYSLKDIQSIIKLSVNLSICLLINQSISQSGISHLCKRLYGGVKLIQRQQLAISDGGRGGPRQEDWG